MAFPGPTPAPAAPSEVWWVRAVEGVASILFGLAALFWPGLTLFVLMVLFGVYVIVYGVVQAVAFIRALGAGQTWWSHLLLAVLGIGAGLVVFAYPGITAIVLLYVVAFWAITIGVVEIAAAFGTGQFLLLVTGLLGILVGFVLLSNPVAGILAYVVVVGVFAIVRGVMDLIGAIRAPAAPAAG